jgi:phage-related tail protein
MFKVCSSKGRKLNSSVHRTQAKLWQTVRCETRTHFRNKKREYFKHKINKLGTHIKNDNVRDLYRGVNEFTKGYQSRTNLLKHEKPDLLAESHSILNRWRNHFGHVLKVHTFHDVRQTFACCLIWV